MCAAHRGRLECAKALLRAGADPNFVNGGGDLTIFWAIDGGVEMIKLLFEYGADLDARSPKDWTPLSYAKACGKYGLSYEKGIYPEVSEKSFASSTVEYCPANLRTQNKLTIHYSLRCAGCSEVLRCKGVRQRSTSSRQQKSTRKLQPRSGEPQQNAWILPERTGASLSRQNGCSSSAP